MASNLIPRFSVASICSLLLIGASGAFAAKSAVQVSIGPPGAITTDTIGNVYFSSPNLVLKLDRYGNLARIAGNVAAGYSGDGGPATQALLSFPRDYPERERDPADFGELVAGLAVDASGTLYIADAYDNVVRKVDTLGTITTIVGPLPSPARWPQGIATDIAGNLYVSYAYGALLKRAVDGTTSELATQRCGAGYAAAGLCGPEGIAVDATGSVYVADGYCRIRKVGTDGSIITVAGEDRVPDSRGFAFTCDYSGDGGLAVNAALSNEPYGVAVDSSGNLYIADTYNNTIRKIDAAGIITTIAGNFAPGYSGDGGPATNAQLNLPHGVAVDATGNIFVADSANNRIRRIAPDGIITTVAGNGEPAPNSEPGIGQFTDVIEYYNAAQDHYFMTGSVSDQDVLDRGVLPGWGRTGESFNAYPTQTVASLVAVCRFFIPPEHGSSHFFSAKATDCAALLAAAADPAHNPSFSGYIEEDAAAFYITAPDATGTCPTSTMPVFRLWNQRFDSNHRYTTSQVLVAQMQAKGYVLEGERPNLAVMCAAM